MYENGKAKVAGYGTAIAMGQNRGAMLESEQRQMEVPAQMQRAASAVHSLGDTVNELLNRLDGMVVRPSVPEPAQPPGNQLVSVGPSTGLGQELHSITATVANLTDRLQDTLRRLEV